MSAQGKVRWGILGCAAIAEKAFITAIKKSRNAELVAIASRDLKKAQAWSEKFEIPEAYGTYEKLLEDPAVDAVYNPLPNHLHFPLTVAALEAGKHVLCEKPLALDSVEAGHMFYKAERHRCLLMEAFMYRFHPRLIKAKELVQSGIIGEPRLIRASFNFIFNREPDNYRWYPEYGGGALYDVGCYTINAARLFFSAEPEQITARAHLDEKAGIDLTTSLLCTFPGSRHALLTCSFELPFESRLEVCGPGGRIFLDRAFSAKHFETEIQIIRPDKTETIKFPSADQFQLMIEHFSDCILSHIQLLIDFKDSMGNMMVITEALRQIRPGRST